MLWRKSQQCACARREFLSLPCCCRQRTFVNPPSTHPARPITLPKRVSWHVKTKRWEPLKLPADAEALDPGRRGGGSGATVANASAWRPLFRGVVDVLQVVRSVDCVVEENVVRTHALYHPSGVLGQHVLLTPDAAGCRRLVSDHGFTHVRCLPEDAVFGREVTLGMVRATIDTLGADARQKGAAWYWQQFLKLGAVSRGTANLRGTVRSNSPPSYNSSTMLNLLCTSYY